jgi:hypothetical protein
VSSVLERKRQAVAKARKAKLAKANRKPAKKPESSKLVRKSRVAVEPIRPDESYALSLVVERFGIGRSKLIKWQKQGMPVGGAGSQKFVLGSTLIEWIHHPANPAG